MNISKSTQLLEVELQHISTALTIAVLSKNRSFEAMAENPVECQKTGLQTKMKNWLHRKDLWQIDVGASQDFSPRPRAEARNKIGM
ncbi:hypothetical protein BM1_00902 [Bipolaris maydis]|nr:hypothetical protein BM1_00902 [Bipolaris maydis]